MKFDIGDMIVVTRNLRGNLIHKGTYGSVIEKELGVERGNYDGNYYIRFQIIKQANKEGKLSDPPTTDIYKNRYYVLTNRIAHKKITNWRRRLENGIHAHR